MTAEAKTQKQKKKKLKYKTVFENMTAKANLEM